MTTVIKDAKISFNRNKQNIEYNDVLNSVFYGKKQARHREVAAKFIQIVSENKKLNMDNKRWRDVCESCNQNPDNANQRHFFYSVIRKIVNIGLIDRTGFTYFISNKYGERLQELANLQKGFKERQEAI